jgi:hypothetical protein
MTTQRNVGSLVGGALLIGIGVLALFGQLFRGFDFWSTFWPFIIIGFGSLFFVGMLAGGKSAAALAIPGSIITVTGLMLFFQNLTGHWESWSYGWTVMLIAVGLGIFIMGAWSQEEPRRQAGLRVMQIGFVLFILFGAFFEMLFSPSLPFGLSKVIFPVALILLGAYLVIARSGLLGNRQSESIQ